MKNMAEELGPLRDSRWRASLSGVSDYRDRHPDDFYQRGCGYIALCQDLVDCGKNEVMLGLFSDEEERVADGRTLMAYGAELAPNFADDAGDLYLVYDLKASALSADSPDAKSAAYVEAFAAMREVSGNSGVDGPASDAYWARAVLNGEFSGRHQENLRTFADLAPSGDGGVASQMRSISEVAYKYRLSGPLRDAVDALAAGDQAGFQEVLERDTAFCNALYALVYRFQGDPPEVDLSDRTAETALERASAADARYHEFAIGNNLEQHPMPEVAAALVGLAGENYRFHARMIERLASADEAGPDTLSCLRSAHELEYMARPEVLSEALERLRQNPGWRQECAELSREYRGWPSVGTFRLGVVSSGQLIVGGRPHPVPELSEGLALVQRLGHGCQQVFQLRIMFPRCSQSDSI